MSDLRVRWQPGDRQARSSLDAVAKHLNVGAKNGDGKEFANLWLSDRYGAANLLYLPPKVAQEILNRPGDFVRAVKKQCEPELNF